MSPTQQIQFQQYTLAQNCEIAAAAAAAATAAATMAAPAAVAGGARRGGGCCGRSGKDFGSAAARKTKINTFTKLQKALKKSMNFDKKHEFWRSQAKTDVTIKFYTKNYPI